MALHAERQLAVDQFTAQRVGGSRFDRHLARLAQRRPVVDGTAQAVEDAAEQALTHVRREGAAEGLDGVAVADAGQVAQGHAGQGGALDGDDLGVEDPSVPARSGPPRRRRRAMPSTSMRRPTSRVTRPVRLGATAALNDACRGWGMTVIRSPPFPDRPRR